MSRAVRFDGYGGIDVLNVVDVEPPVPGPGELLVRVKATSINPGEAKIRDGALAERWPSTFPSGEGSDVAGIVEQVGDDVDAFQAGAEVIGFTDNRAAHAELVVIEAANATPKPPNVSWEAAGSLHVVGATAWAAVRAVDPKPGDTVVVSGGAGGVGSLTVQLATIAGAKVIGLASEHNHEWLTEHGVIPVTYGDGVATRVATPTGPFRSEHHPPSQEQADSRSSKRHFHSASRPPRPGTSEYNRSHSASWQSPPVPDRTWGHSIPAFGISLYYTK